ncbi:transporter (plasmid) [Shinella sp. H4-D48]|uniref:transporter n=1 Tax=Shinella sp. H4-D48 TaxID=2925841 RepID=UPI001F5329A7|nr:transporter [Shinella sp. H4-D48]UNK40939.1 transporter [Shinella sp. H4-D48]
MHFLNKRTKLLAAWLASGFAMSSPAKAVDLDALDLIPAPSGTNAVLSYSTFATRGSFVTTDEQTIKDGTGLDSYVGILRYVHYTDIGGLAFAPQVLLPYGRLYDGSIGGTALESASGIGDPIFAAPLWLVNNKESGTTFAVVPYLFVPLGSYDAGDALNLGENRWKFDLQIGGTQALGNGFTVQASFDAMWYGRNRDAISNGVGLLEQDNTYQGQIWLSYTPPVDTSWNVAVGYSKYWGGEQTLDGIATGSATKSDQIRLQVAKFLTPTFQIQGLLQRDVRVEGGFKEDTRVTLRLMKLF